MTASLGCPRERGDLYALGHSGCSSSQKITSMVMGPCFRRDDGWFRLNTSIFLVRGHRYSIPQRELRPGFCKTVSLDREGAGNAGWPMHPQPRVRKKSTRV